MGQAKARGSREERVAQALAEPRKQRPLTKVQMRELIASATMEYVGKIFNQLSHK